MKSVSPGSSPLRANTPCTVLRLCRGWVKVRPVLLTGFSEDQPCSYLHHAPPASCSMAVIVKGKSTSNQIRRAFPRIPPSTSTTRLGAYHSDSPLEDICILAADNSHRLLLRLNSRFSFLCTDPRRPMPQAEKAVEWRAIDRAIAARKRKTYPRPSRCFLL
eukprot:766490-Hanusia_phi.AAC.1